MTYPKSFASDNHSGVHPRILNAIERANHNHVPAYGYDSFTESAVRTMKEYFGEDADIHFVLNGTAANVLGLHTMLRSHHSIICAKTAHIHTGESGAPEQFIGCKLIPLPTVEGKLTVEVVEASIRSLSKPGYNPPKVISISQCTELGTVYTITEIRDLADYAHSNGMLLHMDGARLAHAAASINVSLREMTGDAGVDVLSFGGSKNGTMLGEAIVFFRGEDSHEFNFIRKQGLQVASKMRFIAVQFEELLTSGLWLENARNANSMAKLLADGLMRHELMEVLYPVETNAIFVRVPSEYIKRIREKYAVAAWSDTVIRLMTSFDTEEQDVQRFLADTRMILQEI